MARILTVCTGNVCRSPLAEYVLRSRLAGLDVDLSSAGVRAPAGHPMTTEIVRIAEANGVARSDADRHRARLLDESLLIDADLVLGMAREHRRRAVELVPASLRKTFTAREFARLARGVSDGEIATEVADEPDARRRLSRATAFVASQRHLSDPPVDPADDDVDDPYRRSWQEHERSAAQLLPAIDEAARVIRAALLTAPRRADPRGTRGTQ